MNGYSFVFLLCGVWMLFVAFGSYHYTPTNEYARNDNKWLIPLMVLGFIYLIMSLFFHKLEDNEAAFQILVGWGMGISLLGGFLGLCTILIHRSVLINEGETSGTEGTIGYKTPKPGDEYVEDTFFARKTNWSLIGPVIISMFLGLSFRAHLEHLDLLERLREFPSSEERISASRQSRTKSSTRRYGSVGSINDDKPLLRNLQDFYGSE